MPMRLTRSRSRRWGRFPLGSRSPTTAIAPRRLRACRAGDVGDHSVTLSASDGTNAVQQAFTITVAAEPVPTAANDAYSTPQDTRLNVNRNQGVLANDSAP